MQFDIDEESYSYALGHCLALIPLMWQPERTAATRSTA